MMLPVVFNRQVPKDLREITDYYEQQSGPELADAFYEELMDKVLAVQENPRQFPYFRKDIRRANLRRFPHHFLFRITSECVRILVIRHNKRNPVHGLRRQ